MIIYEMNAVCDNPLFEGLALPFDLLHTEPDDWRANYQTWQPKLFKSTWVAPEAEGKVRTFNDFPCVNLVYPAFSARAVDMLRDILEPNGELLPVRHKVGIYYFYNCTRMTNCADLEKSMTTKTSGGYITSTDRLVLIDDLLTADLTVFKIRTQLCELFCTQKFVDRVEAAGLQGFLFVRIWPLLEGRTYSQERYDTVQRARKWKPKGAPELDVKANTVVLRLYCEKKKASKKEVAAAEDVMAHLEKSLYISEQASAESYFGNVEAHDIVDHEIRVFLSAPNCDRLVEHLMPSFRTLPWTGKFHVVKRRGEFMDDMAREEYIPVK